MSGKIHKTKGIVLRYVKYGETSIIASVYTELFGLQSYLLNGIRTSGKRGGGRISFFQPAALLDMEVYYNEFKQLNRVKEYRFACVYQHIFSDVLKNGVAAYMVELLTQCLKQPENNYGLFAFTEDCFTALDTCNDKIMANFPVFFAVQLTYFFGFLPQNITPRTSESKEVFFDIEEGVFTNAPVFHRLYLEKKYALILAALLQVRHPQELAEVEADAEARRKILEAMEMYYSQHLNDFRKLKTLPVLKEIMR
ncbi:MAG TPA: DNA repair protein RecO [Niabella sp.]|nr:DNA repair protein RecO [Niabella sp.]